jgi:hypothetical protein
MPDAPTIHTPMKGFRMSLRRLPATALAAAAFAALLSCSDSTAPDGVNEREPTDLRLLSAPHGTPPLVTNQSTFWAVKGRVSGTDIWYRPRPGEADSAKFLEFRLGTASLDRRPDGSTIAVGDSVLITLTVVDPSHFIIDLQPSGLMFSGSDQPRLRVSFAACGDDLNYDKQIDATDAAMLASLSMWRQEAPFQSWFKMTSTVSTTEKEVDTRLGGFTGYALMW